LKVLSVTDANIYGCLEIKRANQKFAQNAKALIGIRPEREINKGNLPPFGGYVIIRLLGLLTKLPLWQTDGESFWLISLRGSKGVPAKVETLEPLFYSKQAVSAC